MRIFITSLLFIVFVLILLYGNWMLSIAGSLFFLSLLWASFFSHKIILSSFSKKKLLKDSSYFRLLPLIKKEFSEDMKVYLLEGRPNLQLYYVSTSPPVLAVSKMLLEQHKPSELSSLLKKTKNLIENNNFEIRQKIVSLFLYLGSFFKKIDSILSFVLGLSVLHGETRSLTRFFINPVLNWLCDLVTPNIKTEGLIKEDCLSERSYLDFKHQNSLLSPISITDTLL